LWFSASCSDSCVVALGRRHILPKMLAVVSPWGVGFPLRAWSIRRGVVSCLRSVPESGTPNEVERISGSDRVKIAGLLALA
jgi:hypothetical protein